jgi:gamma-tubulin complex component 2
MASGAPRASGRTSANDYREERPRVSTNLKGERSDSRKGPPSTTQSTFSNVHKRSASGNPRASSRNEEERRFEARRVTERTFEAHLERAVPRNTSPERSHRRNAPSESRATSKAPRHDTPEARQSRAETPLGLSLLSKSASRPRN